MRLSMLPIVNRVVEALAQVEKDIASVENGAFEILLQAQGTSVARYADRALCDEAKAALMTVLKERKAQLELDLESYGVSLQAMPAIKGPVEA